MCGLRFGRRKGAGQFTAGPLVGIIRGEPRGSVQAQLGRAVGGGRRAVGYLGMAPGTMECPERELESRRVHSATATGRRRCRYLLRDALGALWGSRVHESTTACRGENITGHRGTLSKQALALG